MKSPKKPSKNASAKRRTKPAPSGIRRNARIAGAPAPTGPFNWTAEWNGLVFVSGVRGIEPDTGRPAQDSRRRLDLIFAHLRRILEGAGSSLDRVLSTRVYVTDMALRPMINDAYVRAFGPQLPTRTIVEVAALNQNDSIEIEVVAARADAARKQKP